MLKIVPDEDIIDKNFARQQRRNKHDVTAKHFVWTFSSLPVCPFTACFFPNWTQVGGTENSEITKQK